MSFPLSEIGASLKVTRYFTRLDIDECNVILLYGGLAGRLVEIDDSYRGALAAVLDNPDSEAGDNEIKLRNFLFREGLLVRTGFDELAELRARSQAARLHESDQLSLTICPTLKCNFRCSYCYQSCASPKFDANLQENVIDYVTRRLEGMHALRVTWFGGEPLLALSVITCLSRRFIGLARECGIPYRASIVTNGWLFSQTTSRRLAELGIRKAQITLDGPPALHNQRRRLINGQATFDRILQNIKTADPRIRIAIRVNVDLDTTPYLSQLFDDLDSVGLRGRVSVYFAPVVAYSGVCASIAKRCLQNEIWSLWQAQLQFEALERGYGTLDLPRVRSHVCMADGTGSIVITPHGLAYKCWSDVSEPKQAVLDLVNDWQSAAMRANEQTWQTWTPFAYADCVNCPVLPQCAGGCPQLSMRNQRGYCKAIRYNLRERILLYYLAFRRREVAADLGAILVRLLPESVSFKKNQPWTKG